MTASQRNLYTRLMPALLLTIWFASASFAQDRDRVLAQEYLQQQEQLKRTATLREYDSAVLLLEHGEYARADEKFRYVLANIRSVPSDLTFHFGKNSYHLGHYRQCIDWLNKYIQLKGTGGQFSEEAVEWKTKAEQKVVQQRSTEQQNIEALLSRNYEIDCGPTGKVMCPVCKGEHVVIKKGRLGNEYRTCAYCDEQGLLTCVEYNQLLRGQLKPKM